MISTLESPPTVISTDELPFKTGRRPSIRARLCPENTALENEERRIARLADGWMPQWQPNDDGHAQLERMRGFANEIGRDHSEIGLEGRLPVRADDGDSWAASTEGWRAIGATHMSIVTMGDGLEGADAHIQRLKEYRSAVPA